MNPVMSTIVAIPLKESEPRRALLDLLASFLIELDRDPTDHSALTEQLRIWHRDFKTALNWHENLEHIKSAFISLLLNDVQTEKGPHRMLAPIAAFLQRSGIPASFQQQPAVAEPVRLTPEQLRAARIEAIRRRQLRHAPAVAPVAIEPNLELANRVTELRGEAQQLAARMAVHDEQMQASAAALQEQMNQLNQQEIPQLQQSIAVLQQNQRAVGAQIAQVERGMSRFETKVEETKQALREKREESLGSIAVALVSVAACLALNAVLPGSGSGLSFVFTPSGAVATYTI